MSSTKADNIRALVNSMIEREIERCKKQMGDREWENHREWVVVDFHRVLTHRFHLNLTHPETA